METAQATEIELKVLIECLKKKEVALQQIADITENQGFVIDSELSHQDRYSFFMQMNHEKQESIDRVKDCDEVFANVFQKVGPILDDNPTKYGKQVTTMQNLIRVVMDLDINIRLGEDANSKKLTKALNEVKIKLKEKPEPIGSGEYGSNKIISAYKSNAKPRTN
ncbi:MAG: hypothetical protein FWG68_07620 [Defluviitaleaceae bacterium]|nr:hypothetical protein [Defluviitaleaceae bacterium]